MKLLTRASAVIVAFAGLALGAGGRALVASFPQASAQSTVATPPPATASPIPTPTATATPEYRFVFTPTPSPVTTPFAGPNPPQINEIDLNEQMLTTPGEVHVRVLTSPPVNSVVARTLGREIEIPEVKPGIFILDGAVGSAPHYLRGHTFDVDFVATVPDGRTATVTLALGLK